MKWHPIALQLLNLPSEGFGWDFISKISPHQPLLIVEPLSKPLLFMYDPTMDFMSRRVFARPIDEARSI